MRSHPVYCRAVFEWLESRRLLATYYVDPLGSDQQSGSVAAPWKTLQHAVTSIAPGDTIRVRSGTYAGCRIENSGLPDKPSVLMADDGAAVLITSAGAKNRHQSGIEVEKFDTVVRNWILDGLEVSGQSRYGIDLRHTDRVVVRKCTAHNNAVTGIFLAFCDHPRIESNESYSNGEHGVYDSNSGDDPVIRGNHLHDNAASGLHMNGDLSQGGDGSISRALVENNVVHGNGRLGGSGINCDGVVDSLFRNNLVYAEKASGMSLYQIDGATGSTNNRVINNTILVSAIGRWALNISDSPGNQVRNNVLISKHPTRGAITIDPASLVGFQSDYNACLSRFTTDDNATRLTLAQWQTTTGQDRHSIPVTPVELFENEAADDYRLAQGSAAIDRGSPTDAPADDLYGTARPQGLGFDIGAIERPVMRSSIVVKNAFDAGAGSLRQAILDANAAPGSDVIKMQLGVSNATISLVSPLPLIVGDVTLQFSAKSRIQVGDGDHFPLRSTGRLAIEGDGTLQLDGGLLRTVGLLIDVAGGAALDLDRGALVVDYSASPNPFADIRGYLAKGFNASGLNWDGPGINSHAARDDARGVTSLGVVDNADTQYDSVAGVTFGYGLIGGETLPRSSVLVKYTIVGDTDLNGVVDGDDLTSLLVGHANQANTWGAGDFDANEKVDGDDLTSLLVGYASQKSPVGMIAEQTLRFVHAQPLASRPTVAAPQMKSPRRAVIDTDLPAETIHEAITQVLDESFPLLVC